MASNRSWERWREFRPSKALYFWSCLTCAAGTAALGFASGAWVTTGAAWRMTDEAAQAARAELAANYCVARFESSAGAAKDLAALKETESWRRDDLLTKEGWVTPPGSKIPVIGAADLCVQQLMLAKLPSGEATSTPNPEPAKTGG
jgi:hypothetical protein